MTANVKSNKVTAPSLGKSLDHMSPDERTADMQAFGRGIRKSKETARALLI